MNTYKITKLDTKTVDVTFTVDGKTITDKLDSRYLPIQDAVALDAELNRLLVGMASGVPVVVPAEVVAMVNVVKDVKEVK